MSGAAGRSAEILCAASGMSRESEHPIQTVGFWIFGLISMVLAVLKWTVAPYWSWWRVMLPLLAYLGHNALYILTALICFRWLKHEEEESTTADTDFRMGYNIVALSFFFMFLDNLLRREEGQGRLLAVLRESRGNRSLFCVESVGTRCVLVTVCQQT